MRQINTTIIAAAFVFLSLSITIMDEPNSTVDIRTIVPMGFVGTKYVFEYGKTSILPIANYTQVVLDQANTFKEATGKVVDIFTKTKIQPGVFEALLQVIAIVFGFSIVSIMFSMDKIVARSEDTLRLAKRNDRLFKKAIPSCSCSLSIRLPQIHFPLSSLCADTSLG